VEGLCSRYSLFIASQGMTNRLESQVLAVQETSRRIYRAVLIATDGDDVPEYRTLPIGLTSAMCRTYNYERCVEHHTYHHEWCPLLILLYQSLTSRKLTCTDISARHDGQYVGVFHQNRQLVRDLKGDGCIWCKIVES